jgi:hypothetical protein
VGLMGWENGVDGWISEVKFTTVVLKIMPYL